MAKLGANILMPGPWCESHGKERGKWGSRGKRREEVEEEVVGL